MAATRFTMLASARALLAVPPVSSGSVQFFASSGAQTRVSSALRVPTRVSRHRPSPPLPHRTWFPGANRPPTKPQSETGRPVEEDVTSQAAQGATGAQSTTEATTGAAAAAAEGATAGAAHASAAPAAGAGNAATSARVAELEEEVRQLRDRLARNEGAVSDISDDVLKAKAEADEWKAVALRERADAENARRISKEDVSNASAFAIKSFAKDVLEVPDTLSNALSHAKALGLNVSDGQSGPIEVDSEKVRAFVDGIKAVDRSVSQVLRRHGVKRQEVVENESIFDPDLHEAISMLPNGEVHHHAIINVWQPGYTIGDRVLRAAKVIVADNPSNPAPRPEGAEGTAGAK
eukprot:TRINITY_DN69472_c0_g1_i1.p1 TRINITY_DN69472_c0_g1~~TRINITY_DN69472_c0_g1_i1.p1  ORF type:complete len:349 (+),score=85.26 TRINITY_DN69472_c0_g1_i1:50-1096(+)